MDERAICKVMRWDMIHAVQDSFLPVAAQTDTVSVVAVLCASRSSSSAHREIKEATDQVEMAVIVGLTGKHRERFARSFPVTNKQIIALEDVCDDPPPPSDDMADS